MKAFLSLTCTFQASGIFVFKEQAGNFENQQTPLSSANSSPFHEGLRLAGISTLSPTIPSTVSRNLADVLFSRNTPVSPGFNPLFKGTINYRLHADQAGNEYLHTFSCNCFLHGFTIGRLGCTGYSAEIAACEPIIKIEHTGKVTGSPTSMAAFAIWQRMDRGIILLPACDTDRKYHFLLLAAIKRFTWVTPSFYKESGRDITSYHWAHRSRHYPLSSFLSPAYRHRNNRTPEAEKRATLIELALVSDICSFSSHP